MSDKTYTPASGENYLVHQTGKTSSEVRKGNEKEATKFSQEFDRSFIDEKTSRVMFSGNSKERKSLWLYQSKNKRILAWPGGSIELDAQEYSETSGAASGKLKPLKLTMPGKVLAVKVKEGDIVEAGTGLVVVEAMKMENLLLAPARAKIGKILIQAGDRLESGAMLMNFEAAP